MDQRELKKRLLASAEEALDHLLATKPPHNELTFNQIEDLVGELGRTIEEQTLGELVAVSQARSGPVKCPACGGTAQNKGPKKRQIVSLRGTVEIERRYYYCGECQQGFFPPG